jgi:predicted amidohydrolase
VGKWYITAERSYLHGEPYRNESSYIEVDDPGERELHLDPDCLLWPGVIDLHTLLAFDGERNLGVHPSDPIHFGISGAANTGTLGWDDISAVSTTVMDLPCKRWISLLPQGLIAHPIPPRYQDMTPEAGERIHQVRQPPGGDILGIKIRLGQHGRRDDGALLADGVCAAESRGVGLMVHFTDTFRPLTAIVAALRPRDVLTRVFHGLLGSILVNDYLDLAIANAVFRGIVLDVGHRSTHISRPAFQRVRAEVCWRT